MNNPLVRALPTHKRIIARFINLQESEASISTSRIGQELATNLLPKSIFARGFVDLCDNAFREGIETILVYVGPKLLGEHVFRKFYSKKLDANLKEAVATKASDLLKENNIAKNKKLMPVKAAIAVSALSIPLAEYSLSYFKNLFTLKTFKQADFNNIANLNKDKKETTEHQEKVRQSAKKHIKLAAGMLAGCLGLSALLVTRGKNSPFLQELSEFILAPGSKLFKKEKAIANVNRYFGLDYEAKEITDKAGKTLTDKFGNPMKKLAMSNGQITACVVAGAFGYLGAAKDRGKQDFKEVAYRFPLVGFYAITGASLLEKGFQSILRKKGGYENMLGKDKNFKIPKFDELPKLAEKIASEKGKASEKAVKIEFRKLFKQKSMLILAPFLFGIGFMGLFVAGCSRYFTQYRYNKDKEAEKTNSK